MHAYLPRNPPEGCGDAGVAEEAGQDVYDLPIPLDRGASCRYVRATFAARDPKQKLSLVEAEVWGKDAGK